MISPEIWRKIMDDVSRKMREIHERKMLSDPDYRASQERLEREYDAVFNVPVEEED